MPEFQYLGGANGSGLIESELAQPAQTFDGRFLYLTIFDKGAISLVSMIKDNALLDNIKQMGLTTVSVFSTLNEYIFYIPRDEAVEECSDIAATPRIEIDLR